MLEGRESEERSMPSQSDVQIAVSRGEVPQSAMDQAREKVDAVLRLAPAPVLFARVTLALEAAQGIQRPAIAKAALDVNGRAVRAHVAAATLPEAIDLLEAKLRHGLEILTEKRQSIRHEPAAPSPGSWRHGMLSTARPEWFPRPVDERQFVRHKSYVLREQSVSEAADDLELLDQDWLLLTEQTTTADALLERTEEGYRLTVAADGPAPTIDLDVPVDLRLGVPRMDLPTALTLLGELGTRLVFFVDSDTGRGRVVYHRYDGHYGTLTRADEPAPTPSVTTRS
jgi:ribosome-associated translation inhibitor RaiA